MEKKLDFKLADVSTFVYEGYPLGIMSIHGDKYKEWMLSNYIQLNCHENIVEEKCVFLAFYGDIAINAPFIKKEHLCWSILSQYKLDLVSFLKENIDLGCYLYMKLDEYYIPHREAYHNFHFLHDNLIIGYGEDYFIFVGYDEYGFCSEKKININAFLEGLENNRPDINKNQWQDSIYFLRYAEADYAFNINLVKTSLGDFLYSECSMDKIKQNSNPLEDTVFGIKIYDKVDEYLNILINEGNIFWGGINIDNRVFRIIMEHKNLMVERMKMIQLKNGGVGDLLEQYQKTNKLATAMHYTAIKYQLSANKNLLNKLRDGIVQIKQDDVKILGELYKRI